MARRQLTWLYWASAVLSVSSSRILVLYPLSSLGHKNVVVPIANALADKGHDVDLVSGFRDPSVHPRVREVIIKASVPDDAASVANPYEHRVSYLSYLIPSVPFFNVDAHRSAAKTLYADPFVADLINDGDAYDVVIVNGDMNEIVYGALHNSSAPVVVLQPGDITTWQSNYIRNPNPSTYVPHALLTSYGDRMGFFSRLFNTFLNFAWTTIREVYYIPRLGHVLYLHQPQLSSSYLSEFEKNVSLVLTYSHFSLSYPRPYMQNVVEVGGAHCRPPNKSLTQDLQSFVDGSGDSGFIVFNLLRNDKLPASRRRAFLEAFSKIPQRVIWKWDGETVDVDLPSNVKVMKWIPQQDLLGHPKIRAFITHGSLLSMQEAAYHAVPVIGIPLFREHDLNVNRAVKAGYAVKLQVWNINVENLQRVFEDVLLQDRFRKNASRVSEIFRDQNPPPLEKAVYWIEYLIRHKGAPQLHSGAKDLMSYEYFQVDLFMIILFLMFLQLVGSFIGFNLFSMLFNIRRDESKPPLDDDEDEDLKKKMK